MKKLFALLCILALLPVFYTAAETVEASQDITGKCKFTTSHSKASKMLDNDIKTYWEATKDENTVTVELPGGDIVPGGMVINWYKEPTGWEITEYDAAGTLLNSRTLADSFVAIYQYITLDANTAKVVISVPKGNTIASLFVCSAGQLPDIAQLWEPPVEDADLMVVSTHQDDELLFFGGTIPYYDVVRDMDTIVVYMADCSRLRRGEALTGLWSMGVKTYPEFLNLKDKRAGSFDEAYSLWGSQEALIELLANTIRKYKPEVIVTHDWDGEYGHRQHIITARNMEAAILAAADAEKYPESYSEYGAWQVSKLYLHLGDENVLHMDWNAEYEELGGKTPLEVASIGYDQHKSQHGYYNMEKHGTKYDNTQFSLKYTTVGQDILKNDFFENIVYPTPTPEPTPVPTPVPTLSPEAELLASKFEPSNTAPAVNNTVLEDNSNSSYWIIPAIGAGVIVVAAGIGSYIKERKRMKLAKKRKAAKRRASRAR